MMPEKRGYGDMPDSVRVGYWIVVGCAWIERKTRLNVGWNDLKRELERRANA